MFFNWWYIYMKIEFLMLEVAIHYAHVFIQV